MTKTQSSESYGADEIQVLEGLEPVRKRPGMYIGSTDITGLHHLVWEIIDNGIDEALAGYATYVSVKMLSDGGVQIRDDGRGIPTGINTKTGKTGVEVALTVLHAGGKFGGGIAAPSANRFTKVSPTTAQHVADDLKDTVDIILDGGACEVGIESTIIDLSSKNISILRPGAVTAEDLKKVLGFDVPLTTKSEIKVPGQHEVHYSPQAKIILAQESEIAELTKKLQKENLKNIKVWKSDQNNLNEMAKELYQQFRNADETKLDALIVIPPPHSGIGIAINDRLKRAAKK
jgi:hypothetical protein